MDWVLLGLPRSPNIIVIEPGVKRNATICAHNTICLENQDPFDLSTFDLRSIRARDHLISVGISPIPARFPTNPLPEFDVGHSPRKRLLSFDGPGVGKNNHLELSPSLVSLHAQRLVQKLDRSLRTDKLEFPILGYDGDHVKEKRGKVRDRTILDKQSNLRFIELWGRGLFMRLLDLCYRLGVACNIREKVGRNTIRRAWKINARDGLCCRRSEKEQEPSRKVIR